MIKPYYEQDGIVIYHGDCREILPQLDVKVDLVLTDPPYNIGKDTWDKITGYEEWLVNIFSACDKKLKDNGVLWFFHMDFEVLAELNLAIKGKTTLRHKQLITLDKGIQSIAGRVSPDLRSFPRATEYLQFYTHEDITGAEQLSDQYHAVNPMAAYLRDEIKRAGVSHGEIARLFPSKTGGMTGCVSNWLLGLNFPTLSQYEAIRGCLNKSGDEYLRREYEDLRREYEDLRYYFDIPTNTTDVWHVNCYQDNDNEHSCSKPILPMIKVIEACTKANGLILDPFLGSGTTAVAAKILGRRCIGIEIEEKYCEIAVKRLAQSVMRLEA